MSVCVRMGSVSYCSGGALCAVGLVGGGAVASAAAMAAVDAQDKDGWTALHAAAAAGRPARPPPTWTGMAASY